MSKNEEKSAGKIRGSIRFKILFLILTLSLASLVGFGILVFNGFRMQNIARLKIEEYTEALAKDSYAEFNTFLNAIQASSGLSQDLGELFYRLKDVLNRQQLAEYMEAEYHTAFARELALLGGGAFFEPYAFYPDIERFHYFCSKEPTP